MRCSMVASDSCSALKTLVSVSPPRWRMVTTTSRLMNYKITHIKTAKMPEAEKAQIEKTTVSKIERRMFGYPLPWWNEAMLISLGIAALCALSRFIVSPPTSFSHTPSTVDYNPFAPQHLYSPVPSPVALPVAQM